uniref:Uncharacterized protein n=1 Tax=viral metagenome TaxID=1070528 RepID=A0A6M3LNK3_9ZZZZ
MANRFYVENYAELTQKERNNLRQRYVCQECGEWVNYWLDPGKGTYLACQRHNINQHDGIAKKFLAPDERLNIARRETMDKNIVSVNQALAVRNLPTTGTMNESQALQVCRVYWPDAPDTNIEAAAYLCRDYGLHPGANHIYLIPYAIKDQQGKVIGHRWEMIWSIAAKRLVTMRVKGQYSYIDDTPRKMSEAEEIKILGAVDKSKVRAITRLRNAQGMEASGVGEISASATVKGADKGNSLLNMAMVRSESRALDRLPGVMSLPVIEAIDATYAEGPDGQVVDTGTGEIIEGEVAEVVDTDNEEVIEKAEPEPEKEPAKKPTPATVDKRGAFEKEGRDITKEAIAATNKKPAPAVTAAVLHPEVSEEQPETKEEAKSPIDLIWLKEQLGILQGKKLESWTNAAVIGRLNAITGQSASKVSDAVMYLTAEQAEKFVASITETIEMA